MILEKYVDTVKCQNEEKFYNFTFTILKEKINCLSVICVI